MGKRRDRRDQRLADMAESRSINGPRKIAERSRRDARMRALLRSSEPPYPRIIRNWLAVKLGKREAQITPADVKKLLQSKS